MTTPRETLDRLVAKYPKLVQSVMADHKEHRDYAHDWDHALMVAQYGVIIADDARIGELAWIAGLCHNTDHLFGINMVERKMHYYLDFCSGLNGTEHQQIREAVVNHHGLNDKPIPDNPVTIVLKDADRLGNIGAQVVIRSGQSYPKLPAYDVRYIRTSDPAATHKDPRTVLHDIKSVLEWRPWLRCQVAKELSDKYFALLELCLADIAHQLNETGLDDLPPELILPPELDPNRQQHI